MRQFFSSTIFRLLLAIAAGIVLGYLTRALPDSVIEVPIQVFLVTKQLTSQIILFIVPLILIGCVAPSITSFSSSFQLSQKSLFGDRNHMPM